MSALLVASFIKSTPRWRPLRTGAPLGAVLVLSQLILLTLGALPPDSSRYLQVAPYSPIEPFSAEPGEAEHWGGAAMRMAPSDDDERTELRIPPEVTVSTGHLSNNSSSISNQTTPAGAASIDITISRASGASVDATRSLVVEDLAQTLTFSQLFSDNRRHFESAGGSSKPLHQARIRLRQPSAVSAPPLWRHHEMAAENYTQRKVSIEANRFALKLLQQLSRESSTSRSLVQMPFAIYQALAALSAGAHGDTARELDRVLLASQSSQDAVKLSHDQDRARLSNSLSETVAQLAASAQQVTSTAADHLEQHFLLASNLLIAPKAYEIAPEFRQHLENYYNESVQLTRVEAGSTESVQVVNNWIRQLTGGMIPWVVQKRETFDEFNVMTVLCTSWLKQSWRDSFTRVSSPTKSTIRLKGQAGSAGAINLAGEAEAVKRHQLATSRLQGKLLEFVDDNNVSHFVEHIRSEPTRNIHHFKGVDLGAFKADLVVVPFEGNNLRFIALTPTGTNSITATLRQQLAEILSTSQTIPPEYIAGSQHGASNTSGLQFSLPATSAPDQSQQQQQKQTTQDASLMAKFVAYLANNSYKSMRAMWNLVAPEIITKQIAQNIHQARLPPAVPSDTDSGEQDAQQVHQQQPDKAEQLAPLVQLSIPLLRSELDGSLAGGLNQIGLVNSFDASQANFIGINGHPFNYHALHLSNVIAKTTLNLNELGVNHDRTIKTLESMRVYPANKRKVAASAGGEQPPRTDQQAEQRIEEVRLNRPFVYLICDVKTRLILFSGLVRDPSY